MRVPGGLNPHGKDITGFVAEASDTTSSATTASQTEVVSSSITFTAYADVRYMVTYQGNCESTVTNDQITIKLRWKNSASASTDGDEFAACGRTEYTGASGTMFTMIGTFDSQNAGTVTVTSTIARNLGTGTVRQFASSNQGNLYFLVQAV